ncbi:BREX-1 system adenine-specific DNA-methyltransferase PglX, partial [Ligilactobacillus murinus]|uniref:BREX-1 system adenine-specific DNA-methyltransferase PglX n=1 Tax=Ligilactobacillus murinus TaxID=1622 RepID=UPI001CDD0C44
KGLLHGLLTFTQLYGLYLRNIPVIVNQKYEIINFVQQAILLTKEDWDLNENTWNFKISPLI